MEAGVPEPLGAFRRLPEPFLLLPFPLLPQIAFAQDAHDALLPAEQVHGGQSPLLGLAAAPADQQAGFVPVVLPRHNMLLFLLHVIHSFPSQ